MQKVFTPLPVRRADNLQRTDWFKPDEDPTIPGLYECSTMADDRGHVFQRRWDGEQWVNSVTGLPTKVRMHWRGVKPGTVEIGLYPSAVRVHLRETYTAHAILQDQNNSVRARAAQALYDETMTTP